MDPAALRNSIEWHGSVLDALDQGVRGDDIDDEELSDMWYELQVAYDNLMGEIAAFEDELNNRILDVSID